MVSEPGLARSLREAGVKHTVVGDAKRSADIYAATQAGYRAARELQ